MPTHSEIPLDLFREFAKEAGVLSAVGHGLSAVGKTVWSGAKRSTKGKGVAAAGLLGTGAATAAIGVPSLAGTVAQNKNTVQQGWKRGV